MKLQWDLFSPIYQKRCWVFKARSSSGWIPEIERHKMVEVPYVFLEYNDTLTSYRRNSSSRWPSCFESAVAAGRSLRRWFRCRETS
ncbi:hypothetical protein Bca101_078160 [Brassica carinata]